MSTRTNHARLEALTRQMQAAAEAMDFEEATRLRNEIARLKGEAGPPTTVEHDGEQVTVTVGQAPPGQIGLGSNAPLRQPPKGWVKPKKPDLMTKNVKPRGGR